MLIEFRAENHRSLREEQALTMEAGPIGDSADPRPRRVKGHKEPLLPVAALYGANASGKTNVLSAFAFMRNAVLYSHRQWDPAGGVPRTPFAWGGAGDPSFFEVTVLIDGVKYQYGFVCDSERFLEEWLYAWPNGRKQTWFERDGAEFSYDDYFKGEKKQIERVTGQNALYLSAAGQLRQPQVGLLNDWFHKIEFYNLSQYANAGVPFEHIWMRQLLYRAFDLLGDSPAPPAEVGERTAFKERVVSLLQSADTGIADVRMIFRGGKGGRESEIQMKHRADRSESWLPYSQESKGTQKLFDVAFPVLEALQSAAIFVVDELEASLHPALAEQIVRLFNDPATNPNNAQLIFTTHDTNLIGTALGDPALRRDQVWLTEKDGTGGTVLYPLTDYKPRKAENLERGYLQGRYGAIPFLGNLAAGISETVHAEKAQPAPPAGPGKTDEGRKTPAPRRVRRAKH